MIYLIGGPPKCGKTTLAKLMSKKFKIPWVSSDTLQVVVRESIRKHVPQKKIDSLYPSSVRREKTNDEKYSKYTPLQVVRHYQQQAKSTQKAIEMFTLCELIDGNDFIIEGYHITPALVSQLLKQHGHRKVKGLFLIKTDEEELYKNFSKTKTPNDWIISQTKNKKETFPKIARMISAYSQLIESEAKKYKLKVINTDHNFSDKLKEAANYLCTK